MGLTQNLIKNWNSKSILFQLVNDFKKKLQTHTLNHDYSMFIHALVTNNNLMKKMILLKNKLKMVFALQITSYTLKLLSSIFFIFHQKKTLEKFQFGHR